MCEKLRDENYKNTKGIIQKTLSKGLVPRTLSYHFPSIQEVFKNEEKNRKQARTTVRK